MPRQSKMGAIPAGFFGAAAIAWACLGGCAADGLKAGHRDAGGYPTGVDAFAATGGAGGNNNSDLEGASQAMDCADASALDSGAGQDVTVDVTIVDASAIDGSVGQDASVVEIPLEIPSHQKVIFRVTNGASAVRYLAVDAQGVRGGPYCSPYSISQGTTNLTLAIPYQCGCECAVPPEPGITALWLISPGQTKDLVWDARALTTYSTSVSCAPTWGPMAPAASVTHGVWQPVAAGSYQATLITKSDVPASCQQQNEVAYCSYWSEDSAGRWSGGICDRTTTVKAQFDLPQEGDVIVPITL